MKRQTSVRWALLVAASAPLLIGGCAQDAPVRAEAAALVSEPTISAASTSTLAPSTTRASTTTSSTTTTTSTTSTTTTLAPTTVETLPTPAPPPPPRADEGYTVLGSIRIPKIGVDAPLLEGITLTTLDRGPGHWPGTAMPGALGNAVVAGHRTSHGRVFRNIDQLTQGDEVIFTTADGEFRYLVDRISIVQPDAMYIIAQTPERTATLFACHPPGSTRQRIVAHLVLAA